MQRIRKPQGNYTIIPNGLIQDPNLSLKAKGLYALLASKPDKWEYHETALIKESRDSRDAFRGGVRELVEAGWIEKRQSKDGGGKYAVQEWFVHIEAKPVDGLTVDGKSVYGKTVYGKTYTNKTNSNKTEVSKTDLSYPPLSPLENKPVTKKKAKNNAKTFELPSFINQQTWQDFLEHRERLRKPMTSRAKELMVKKLEGFWCRGEDVNLILEQSILQGWQGVFSEKEKNNGKINRGRTLTETIAEQLAHID